MVQCSCLSNYIEGLTWYSDHVLVKLLNTLRESDKM